MLKIELLDIIVLFHTKVVFFSFSLFPNLCYYTRAVWGVGQDG